MGKRNGAPARWRSLVVRCPSGELFPSVLPLRSLASTTCTRINADTSVVLSIQPNKAVKTLNARDGLKSAQWWLNFLRAIPVIHDSDDEDSILSQDPDDDDAAFSDVDEPVKSEPQTTKHRLQGPEVTRRRGDGESRRDGASSGVLMSNASSHSRVAIIGNVVTGRAVLGQGLNPVCCLLASFLATLEYMQTVTNTGRERMAQQSPPANPNPKAKPKPHPQSRRKLSTFPPPPPPSLLPARLLPPGAAKTTAATSTSANPLPHSTSPPPRPRCSRCA